MLHARWTYTSMGAECTGCGWRGPVAKLRFVYEGKTITTVPLCLLCRCAKRAELRDRHITSRVVA
jgi:hypothetical protein